MPLIVVFFTVMDFDMKKGFQSLVDDVQI